MTYMDKLRERSKREARRRRKNDERTKRASTRRESRKIGKEDE